MMTSFVDSSACTLVAQPRLGSREAADGKGAGLIPYGHRNGGE